MRCAWLLSLVMMIPLLSAQELTRARPDDVGMDAAKLAQAVALYRAAVDSDAIRGAVVFVARRGRCVLHEALGWCDAEQRRPMTRDTVFRMASNTKPVVATGILALAEQGRLHLDAPVARYLPAWDRPRARDVTVAHLLSHTSGLRIPSLFVMPLMKPTKAHPDAPTLRLEADRIGKVGPVVEPGTSYAYSNPGYNTLGAIIEAVSGRPLSVFLASRVYAPLGMRDAMHWPTGLLHKRMSHVYRRSGDRWRISMPASASPRVPFVRASGGLLSTARDYARFCEAWRLGGALGGVRILKSASVRRAILPHAGSRGDSDGGASYGYGWGIGSDRTFSHSGSDGTYAWVSRERELVGLVFTQSQGGRHPRNRFRRLVHAACTP